MRFSALGGRAQAPAITRLMTAALETPGLLSLAAGFTDNATLPCAAVREISQTLLGVDVPSDVLQYGTNQGRAGLRELVADRLNRFDGASVATTNQVLVTNGSQQALYLAMQVLADPGDIVLVDRPSYFVYLEMLKGLGLRAVTLPTGADGSLDLIAVEALLARLVNAGEADRVKAVYLVSYFSNPSSRSLSRAEKVGLAEVLTRQGLVIPVLEDAAYRELFFAQPCPAPSVFGLAEWQAFPRLYLGTLTKPFATGLKVGYGICSDSDWLARMLNVKGHQDFGTAQFNQAILEKALAEGHFDRQVDLLRTVYREKAVALDQSLVESGVRRAGWTWGAAEGGLYLWLKGPSGVDTSFDGPLFARARGKGVLYVPGDLCFGDQVETNHLRLSYGVLAPVNLREAARRLAAALVS